MEVVDINGCVITSAAFNVPSTSSIDDLGQFHYLIYPNPSRDIINISVDNNYFNSIIMGGSASWFI